MTQAGVGANRYAYAGGDPVNGIDPTGHAAFASCWPFCKLSAALSGTGPSSAPNSAETQPQLARKTVVVGGGSMGGAPSGGISGGSSGAGSAIANPPATSKDTLNAISRLLPWALGVASTEDQGGADGTKTIPNESGSDDSETSDSDGTDSQTGPKLKLGPNGEWVIDAPDPLAGTTDGFGEPEENFEFKNEREKKWKDRIGNIESSRDFAKELGDIISGNF